MTRSPRYDKHPKIQISSDAGQIVVGWQAIVAALAGNGVTCVECYPGAPVEQAVEAWRHYAPATQVIDTRTLFRIPAAIETALAPTLTDDPVFGRFAPIGLDLFLDDAAIAAARIRIAASGAPVAVIGTGALFVHPTPERIAHVSMARWELQQRQRRGEIGNLGAGNGTASAAAKYKRAYFVDWRVGDEIKKTLIDTVELVIDANASTPRAITGETWRAALATTVSRPFRVVPFFDPGVWGGQWMRESFDLPDGPPNFAWCFDCVPEENSLLLGFGGETVELPAIDLVFAQPVALLGEAVYHAFGAEFPIRFDMLDTMDGGNLSLQVHPLADYARRVFNLAYTQDESYYLLDAKNDGVVYLGLKNGVDPAAFEADLRAAQGGGVPFAAEKYVNVLSAKPHDHFLIPAGTVHGAGRNSMVLEISATPYIFTFKLWDWGRLGMDDKPRPIHLDHGLNNIQWDRSTGFVQRELVNAVEPLAENAGYRIERTGLHALETIETERAWFTGSVPLDTRGSVNVLNLVAGDAAIVESPTGAFSPFPVSYVETFIMPAAVGAYTIRPARPRPQQPLAVLCARVRERSK